MATTFKMLNQNYWDKNQSQQRLNWADDSSFPACFALYSSNFWHKDFSSSVFEFGSTERNLNMKFPQNPAPPRRCILSAPSHLRCWCLKPLDIKNFLFLKTYVLLRTIIGFFKWFSPNLGHNFCLFCRSSYCFFLNWYWCWERATIVDRLIHQS